MMSIGKRKYFSVNDSLSSPIKKRFFLQFIQIPIEIRDLILLKLSPHELDQLASTNNKYFFIVLNFLQLSMGTRYFKLILEITSDRHRSGAWENLTQPLPWKSEYIAELLFYCGRELLTNVIIAFAVARQRKTYYEIIQTAIEDSFEHCTLVAQRDSIVIHLQNAFRCVTRNVIAVLASSTITQTDQLYYLQQLEVLDIQKASLISFLLTKQFEQNN
ncbi:unnamed protein product [Rotaria sp. Silwood1]|nr:unnamed protein product [Rotaria sp. Silwood1]